MESDVQTVTLSATGSAFAVPGRVKSIYFVSTATAGTITLKNGGSGGLTLLALATPAFLSGWTVDLPGNGIRFTTDCYVTLSAQVTSITLFYA